jgi:tripartite-type tricarboxylate transporter receptor subunit TctC
MQNRLAIVTLLLLPAFALHAQDTYPSRPITVLVPFPPGSGSDLIPRTLAPLMSQSMNVPILVENRPGAGGSVGAGVVAKAKPDGYTVLMAPTPVLAVNKWLYKDLAYDPEKDFAPITNAASTPNLLVVHPSIAAGTLKELIEQAKRESLSFASGGSGTTRPLCGELLKTYAKVDMVHVPYKGPGPAVQDLLAGRVPVMCDNLSNVISHVRAGKLKAIALTAKTRHPQAPNVPTSEEAGLPGFEAGVWYSFAAPVGTPRPVIDRLNAEFAKALRTPTVVERFRDLGLAIVADSPDDFARFVAAESAKWKRIVEVSGAKVD